MFRSDINLAKLKAMNQTPEEERYWRTKSLLKRADNAIAWGVPDRDSIGYTHSELISLIRELSDRIKELDSQK